jgi:hypothetical protein
MAKRTDNQGNGDKKDGILGKSNALIKRVREFVYYARRGRTEQRLALIVVVSSALVINTQISIPQTAVCGCFIST